MWRLRLDAGAGRMALETRDADLLLAEFYTLDLSQHLLSKLPFPAAKNWWLGLEDAHNGLLLLHGYGNRQIGEHKGIMAYTSETGELQWEQPELAFYGVSEEGVLAFDTELQNLALLNANTGTILTKNVSVGNGAQQVAAYNAIRSQDCIYPMLYLQGEAYFTEVSNFVQYSLQVSPVKGIEYAETDKYVIVSYYAENKEEKLDNWLAVFDLDGKLIMNEQIAHTLSGIGSDTFIIFKQKLYFIRQRNSLVVYSLK